MYYKIVHNNQIIDVSNNVRYVRCLPRSQRTIAVDERQANGIVSSDGHAIYHIYGTPNTFIDSKLTVQVIEIEEEEYLKLTTQLKEQQDLANRVKELEKIVQELYLKMENSL